MAGADRKHREALGRPVVAGGYRAEAPHQRAQACTIKPRVERRLKPETALWGLVMSYLKAGYSPEQVAGTLALLEKTGAGRFLTWSAR